MPRKKPHGLERRVAERLEQLHLSKEEMLMMCDHCGESFLTDHDLDEHLQQCQIRVLYEWLRDNGHLKKQPERVDNEKSGRKTG